MSKEELEEFLEMVKEDAFVEEYGFSPSATKEHISKFYNRFDELKNKLYTDLGIK